LAGKSGLRRIRAVVGLHEHHDRFLKELMETIGTRTGHRLNRSALLRLLIENAMALGFVESDIDQAYTEAYGLETLLSTKEAIRSEIRHTEAELKQTLRDSPEDDRSLRLFRRNLAYQMRRLAALEIQIARWERAANGDGNGAARVARCLLARRLRPE
jgi:hypothetical protein